MYFKTFDPRSCSGAEFYPFVWIQTVKITTLFPVFAAINNFLNYWAVFHPFPAIKHLSA